MRISSQARIYAAGIALVLGLAGVAAHAQPSPAGPRAEAPLHIIVGYAPGGAADSVARAYAEQVRLDTGGTVIVENRPGASARLALEYVKQSKPDGRIDNRKIIKSSVKVMIEMIFGGGEIVQEGNEDKAGSNNYQIYRFWI